MAIATNHSSISPHHLDSLSAIQTGLPSIIRILEIPSDMIKEAMHPLKSL